MLRRREPAFLLGKRKPKAVNLYVGLVRGPLDTTLSNGHGPQNSIGHFVGTLEMLTVRSGSPRIPIMEIHPDCIKTAVIFALAPAPSQGTNLPKGQFDLLLLWG